MKIVISPIGTSSLTNGADEQTRSILNTYANARRREEIPQQILAILDAYIAKRKAAFAVMDRDAAKKSSAELHSLLILLEEHPPQARDRYYLIPTSTYIGEITYRIVLEYLEAMGLDVHTIRINGLQTNSSRDLHLAFSDLVVEIDALYQSYKPQNAKIIFNLTGGFKAIQGFLQTLSVVYADETVYVFERESELMRIPRLPVKMVAEDYIRDNPLIWRRLALGQSVDADQLTDIPSTFLFELDGQIILSEYGNLLWQNVKTELYKEGILPCPSSKAQYSPKFEKSTLGLSPDRYYQLNRQIDVLCRYLESERQDMLKSLSFKKISDNAVAGSTHEFYAWSDDGAKRVFCHYSEANVLILDELDNHL